MDTNLLIYGVPTIGIIIALVELAKKQGLSKRYAMILSTVLGIIAGVISYQIKGDPQSIILGLVVGLSASGVYDFKKIKGK